MVEEMREVAEAIGIATPPYGSLLLAALRGQEAELGALIETAVNEAVARGEGLALGTTAFVRATLYNGLGRYEAALAVLREADRSDGVGMPTLAESELVEAAVRSGQPEIARDTLADLANSTRASGTAFAAGIEARSRALVSDRKVAEDHYRDSIERLTHTRVQVELARAHLVYGEWLRRERRRVDAREQLRMAHEMFTEMGVDAFAGRAGRELLATGERVRRRSVEAPEELTSQEAQVARLAREGLSNPEIGARLFISRHTVEYHLRKVFTKLGINSRHQLERALPPEAAAAPS
jgi:DNA-binding CsgD family transcriptional regulator/predicted nucleic acid-binding protein